MSALQAWPATPRDALPLALWNADSIAAATGGRASGAFEIANVEIDSRDCRPGDLFVALKGESMDGHRFLDAAFANGARAALVDRPIDAPHVLVPDTAAALRALAEAARMRGTARRVAVTGSVGKTGVKEAIFAALDRSSRGAAHRSVRSYNNHVGVPLSLARMPARARFGVFEMGMNHAGEIAALTLIARPHVALVTTIAPAHIKNLGSMEAIADAKAEIFAGLEPSGTAVIPADSPYFPRLRAAAEAAGARILSFGRASYAQLRLLDAIATGDGGSLVTAEFAPELGGGRLCFTVAEPGEHWIANALAVMAAVRAAGGDLAAAGLALAELGGMKGRGRRIDLTPPGGGRALLIDESYNANPASMRATLRQLGQTPAARRIAVLGAMKELGDFAPGFHAALAEPLTEAGVDAAILVGEEMAPLAGRLGAEITIASVAHCADADEAHTALEALGIAAGDAILVKGSNSVGLGALVQRLAGAD